MRLGEGFEPVCGEFAFGFGFDPGPAVLAGFRGLALELLMLKAEGDLRRGETWALPDDYRLIVGLEPRSEEIWEFLAYQLAFNLAEDSEASRWHWTREGLRFCDEGLERLPESPLLHRLKGQIYSRRLHDPKYGFMKDAVLREEGRRDLDLAVESLALASRFAVADDLRGFSFLWALVEIDLAQELGREGDLARAVEAFSRAGRAIDKILTPSMGIGKGVDLDAFDFALARTRVALAVESLSLVRDVLQEGDHATPAEIGRAVKLIDDFEKSSFGEDSRWVDRLRNRLEALEDSN